MTFDDQKVSNRMQAALPNESRRVYYRGRCNSFVKRVNGARRMRIFVLLLTFVILACKPLPTRAEPTEAAAPVSRAKSCGESIPNTSTEEFNKKCIALAGPLAAMRGGMLVLRMDNGDRKNFNNKDGTGAMEGGYGYGLADFYPSTHIFVVADFGVDAGRIIAVDGRTGRTLDFGYASPHFSPLGNWALTIEYDVDGVTESDFAILDVRGKKPIKIWASKTSKKRLPAKAKFAAWVNDRTISFTSSGQKSVFLFQADNGAWDISTTMPSN
ncbi:hypothetical protein IY145_23465 [Methylosinus sp. H3A]|uniref:hypothetical protein n=1 Tax=Methylosinus sp. H3A TaxID=2785786 RepID=UPI0018C2D970|nr:hypothetical protein [Methylosinus sp. H3A]MBG0812308.1 hypothetical protein [Methylosinus sp. H3A]